MTTFIKVKARNNFVILKTLKALNIRKDFKDLRLTAEEKTLLI